MADFDLGSADKEPSFSSDVPPTRKQKVELRRKQSRRTNQSQPQSPPPVNEQPANSIDIGEIASFIFGLVVLVAIIYGVFYIGSVVVNWFTEDEPTISAGNHSTLRNPMSSTNNETDRRLQNAIKNSRDSTKSEPQSVAQPNITVHKLSNIQSGTCKIGQFKSQGGLITIGSKSIKTNWRRIEFINCVERGDENYLIAEGYGNKAVSYLVIDNTSALSKSSIYGCVLHSKYKVIKKKPASFLPITCSEASLQSLR